MCCEPGESATLTFLAATWNSCSSLPSKESCIWVAPSHILTTNMSAIEATDRSLQQSGGDDGNDGTLNLRSGGFGGIILFIAISLTLFGLCVMYNRRRSTTAAVRSSNARTVAANATSANRIPRDKRKERAKFVDTHLQSTVYKRNSPEEGVTEEGEMVDVDLEAASTTSSATWDPDLDSRELCSICLHHFRDGDVVSQSTNNCKHMFHRECVAAWLSVHKECPLCRELFLKEDLAEETASQAQQPEPNSRENNSSNEQLERETRLERERWRVSQLSPPVADV